MKVLLADFDPDRANVLEKTLAQFWDAEVVRVHSADEAIRAGKDAKRRGVPFDKVMAAFGFRDFDQLAVFQTLCRDNEATGILISESSQQPLPSEPKVNHLVVVESGTAVGDSGLRRNLVGAIGPEHRKLPKLSIRGTNDKLLLSQIRWLNHDGALDRGKDTIRRLVAQIEPNCKSFHLSGLGQGHSGASVFRVRCELPNSLINRVLKLTPNDTHQAWKCVRELEIRQQIEELLGGDMDRMAPRVHGVRVDKGTKILPAEADGRWMALLYDFVHMDDAPVVDFERVLLDPESCLNGHLQGDESLTKETLTEDCLRSLLRCLDRRLWRGGVSEDNLQLWSPKNAGATAPLTFPPYRFRAWTRDSIITSLLALKRYGDSLDPLAWTDRWSAAWECVAEPVGIPPILLGEHRVPLCPVHGDMNANNILILLDTLKPYLIDFANFQENGHALQDLARLEVAVKIEHMGRECGGPRGMDLNSQEFPKWCEAENWLTAWQDDETDLGKITNGFPSVERAFKLCLMIRRQARELFGKLVNHPRKGEFELSYDAALLYFTLCAISYDSLTRLKRILANYSAGGIVQSLKQGCECRPT